MKPEELRRAHERWLNSDLLDAAVKTQLSGLTGAELESYFAPLSFGTAGVRAILGPGDGRLNIYTARRIFSAFGESLSGSVCICYDCRHQSLAFAQEAARVMAGLGLSVLLFSDVRPTPELAFAVRHYGCAGGINITASHNPKDYSGIKLYGEDGAQLLDERTARIAARSVELPLFEGGDGPSLSALIQEGRVRMLGEETDRLYMQCIESLSKSSPPPSLKIVYSAFHGAGGKIFPALMERRGYAVECVLEQLLPDPDFKTLENPNPEEEEGLALSLALAEKTGADLIVATDPDADRVSVCARDAGGVMRPVPANHLGALLFDYLLDYAEEGSSPAVIKSFVTSDLAQSVAQKRSARCFETATGFKHMAKAWQEREKEGSRCLLAFEESIGYMPSPYIRDKDGISAAMLVIEMAEVLKSERKLTLHERLSELFLEHGGFFEITKSVKMDIRESAAVIERLMRHPPSHIGSIPVETDDIPFEQVLRAYLPCGSKVVFRPSGTEPKFKIYVLARGADVEEARQKAVLLMEGAYGIIFPSESTGAACALPG